MNRTEFIDTHDLNEAVEHTKNLITSQLHVQVEEIYETEDPDWVFLFSIKGYPDLKISTVLIEDAYDMQYYSEETYKDFERGIVKHLAMILEALTYKYNK